MGGGWDGVWGEVGSWRGPHTDLLSHREETGWNEEWGVGTTSPITYPGTGRICIYRLE